MGAKPGVQIDLFGAVPPRATGSARAVGETSLPGVRDVAPRIADPIPTKAVIPPSVIDVVSGKAIQDAGAELVYNRRNRVKTAKGWSDIAHLNDALKVKEAVKGNVWPKPDYKQLIEDGMQPMVAHIVKQVYDSVAVKPVIGGRDVLDDAALQRYIAGLNRVESGVMQWARDSVALKHWADSNARYAGAMLGQRISITELAAERKTLLDAVCPGGWKEYRAEVLISGGNKLLAALQPKFDEIKRAIKAIDGGWPEKREAWEVQGFRVVENPVVIVDKLSSRNDGYFLTVHDKYVKSFDSEADALAAAALIKPFVLFGKRGFVDSFESETAAIDAAKERTRREKGGVVGEKGERVEAIEREGVSRRMEGEDVSSERLKSEFGLKGVNFGNWMKTPSARAEAQLHLNHAFDSLHDLAEILGVPPKAMSLNGMLGLAIGAQGAGGAYAAHFVPGVNEINLTRTNGAGSLAHEWAHAMDHYFATQAGLATAEEPYLTEHAHLGLMKPVRQMVDGKVIASEVPRFSEVRPEIVSVFGAIVDAMDKRLNTADEAQTEREARLGKAKGSLENWLKAIRRDFDFQPIHGLMVQRNGKGVLFMDAFDEMAARVRAGDVGYGRQAISKSAYISPVVVEMRDLYKAKTGRVYSIDNIKSLQHWIDTVGYQQAQIATDEEHVPQKVATEFAKNANALDKEKGGKSYWGTRLEKFARAFDAFVSDELEARGARNGYLSHPGRAGVTVPMGAEREAVNGAFRTLVDKVKVREMDRGAVLFSCGKNGSAASQDMSVSVIETEINRMRQDWSAMPPVKVVNKVSDLPFTAPINTDGAYCDGRVYVVAENIENMKQLQKVMAHECVLHHSLEEMLGDYGFSKLHCGIQKLKKSGDTVVTKLADEILQRYGVLSPQNETKEIVARAGEQCLDDTGNVKVGFGFMKSVFAGVASWFRDHGISFPFTNIELQGIMHDAGEWVKRDVRGHAGGKRVPAHSADRLDGAVLNSFAGVRAENAPLDALRLAREMMLSGVADRAIWQETGWTFGFADGKPRFEIPDNLATWHGTVVRHPDVYKAYEDSAFPLCDIPWYKVKKAGGAYYSPEGMERIVVGGDESEKLSSGLHELQHAIQYREGFARGGKPEDFHEQDVTDKELSRINQEVHRLYEQNPEFYRDSVKATQLQIAVKDKFGSSNGDVNDPLVQEWWAAIDQRDTHPESVAWFSLKSEECYMARDRVLVSPMDQYTRLAGEVEARLTQARRGMSADERAAAYPVDQMDVAVKDQIVRLGAQVPGLVVDGLHSGKVLDVAAGVVTQKVGRGGETVRHSACRLSSKVEIGDVVDIQYRDGVGVVGKELGTDKSLAR